MLGSLLDGLFACLVLLTGCISLYSLEYWLNAGQCRQGEHFDRQRHAIGTEIKAITYSAMQIHEKPSDAEIFVIVDI